MRKEKAVLVTVVFPGLNEWPEDELSSELCQLSVSTGVEALEEIILHPKKPTAPLFIGKGQAEDIHAIVHEKEAETVIFNNDLSSAQQRNLEEIIGIKVIDRTQLILDIFARRAKSLEGKVQVELAQLEYLLPRLAGKGVMLSRLGGGIGTRGPGEQKLEVDRRKISRRIVKLKSDLAELKKRRRALALSRKDKSLPVLALIGYTNAGKSTLMNALCDEHQRADDRPFTTVDTVVRKLLLPNNQSVLISDTVGFIYNLPHHLIEAFKATLEEVIFADILIHALDISSPMYQQKASAVYNVLTQLGAEKKPMLVVLNKIDKLDNAIIAEKDLFENQVSVSARDKKNIEALLERIVIMLSNELKEIKVFIPHDKMALINILYKEGRVVERRDTVEGVYLKVVIPKRIAAQLEKIV